MNTNNDTATMTGEELTPESVLAGRGIPRQKLKEWREAGKLLPGEHFMRDGKAILLTAAGVRRTRELAGLPPEPLPGPARVPVVMQQPGAMPRIIRCKLESGVMVSVRLTAPRVFASQFRRNDRLAVLPTELDGVYEYDGAAPRRCRI